MISVNLQINIKKWNVEDEIGPGEPKKQLKRYQDSLFMLYETYTPSRYASTKQKDEKQMIPDEFLKIHV